MKKTALLRVPSFVWIDQLQACLPLKIFLNTMRLELKSHGSHEPRLFSYPMSTISGRRGCEKLLLKPESHVDQPDHHRHLHQRSDHRRKGLT